MRRKAGAERTRRKKYKQNDCFPQKGVFYKLRDKKRSKESAYVSYLIFRTPPKTFFMGWVRWCFSEEKSLTLRLMIVSQSDALLTDSGLAICFIFSKVKNVVFSDENGVFCIFLPNAAFVFLHFSARLNIQLFARLRPTQHLYFLLHSNPTHVSAQSYTM